MLPTDGHISIIGVTSSGKSYYAEEQFKRCKTIAIYFNTQLLDIKGIQIQDAYKIKQLIADRVKKIVFNPSGNISEARGQLAEIIRELFDIAKVIVKDNKRRIWVSLFVDEAQDFAPKLHPDAPLNSIYRQGLRWGIQGISIAQRGAELSQTVLTQSRYKIVFNFLEAEKPYLDKYFPTDRFWEHIQMQYHYVVIEGNSIKYCTPIAK